MKRLILFVLVLVLVAVSAAAGGAAGWWAATERGLVRSSLANNTTQLLILAHLRSGDLDEATRQLDWEIDARAVFLGSMLAQGELSAKLQPLVSCHLQRIQNYRSEHPVTHEDSEFGALVAAALARPAGCSTPQRETAARPQLTVFVPW